MKYLNKKIQIITILFFMLCTIANIAVANNDNEHNLTIKAEQGDMISQYFLANLLLSQTTNKYANDQAFHWYEKSADQGYADAQFALAVMCMDSDDMDSDDVKYCISWFEKAAEQNHLQAQYYLGNYYQSGDVYDISQALHWYQKSAEQGYVIAQMALGNLYFHHVRLMEPNKSYTEAVYRQKMDEKYKKAIYWYKKAAEGNEPFAELNLGIIEMKQSNHQQALYWLNRACKNNFTDACQLASTLVTKNSLQ